MSASRASWLHASKQSHRLTDWLLPADYKRRAWGHDSVTPLTGSGADETGGYGASIFESLEMLLLLGLEDEYELARKHSTSTGEPAPPVMSG